MARRRRRTRPPGRKQGLTAKQLGLTTPEQRQRFRRDVQKQLNFYRRLFKKKVRRAMTKQEEAIYRRFARADVLKRYRYLRQAMGQRIRLAQSEAPAQAPSWRAPRELQYGARPTGRGRVAGLGGTLSRRVHRSVGRQFKLHKPHWIDPFPWIPGTVPEKMIFEALYRRQIYFIFQAEWADVIANSATGAADLPVLYAPAFKPDFVLPEYRVVIDPFSEFHHSLPGAVKRDIEKRVLYSAMGWTFVTPWAHEVVERGGYAIVDEIPELRRPPVAKLSEKDEQAKRAQGYRLGPNVGAGAFSVGIANRKRRRPPTLLMR